MKRLLGVYIKMPTPHYDIEDIIYRTESFSLNIYA